MTESPTTVELLIWRSPEVGKSKYHPERCVASVSLMARPNVNAGTVITPVDALAVAACSLPRPLMALSPAGLVSFVALPLSYTM